ncbi:MAG: hypothetical protein R2860_15210 [Desulfobacterales bacterium]
MTKPIKKHQMDIYCFGGSGKFVDGTCQCHLNLSGDGTTICVVTREHSEANSSHRRFCSKTFADSHGDRFIFFGLVEAADNFDEVIP